MFNGILCLLKFGFETVKNSRVSRRYGAFYEKILKSFITFPFLYVYAGGCRLRYRWYDYHHPAAP